MIYRFFLCWMLALLLTGCEPTTVAEQDGRDHESPLIRRALEREQVGDLDGAIQTYEEVLQESPKLISAHFHLALLLQDYRKDYMGAIYHYRQYERLRPNSEKKTLLRERTRICQQLLVAQLLSTGDVTVSRKQLELVTEIDKLNKRLSQVEGEKAALVEQKTALDHQLLDQKAESDRLHRLLDRVIPASSSEEARPRSVLPRLDPNSSALATPPSHPAAVPEKADIPAATQPAASQPPVIRETPPPQPKPVEPAPATVAEHPAPPAPITAATRTYVVQPGDSVYRIAERVYGDPMQWKKVRDANRERLGPDNQLRAGQVLVVP